MKIRSIAVLAGAIPTAVLVGFGGGALAAPAQPEEQEEVAMCVLGEWESTGITVEHEAMEDFEVGGAGGVLLTIDEDGTATVDFTGMDRSTFEGEAHDRTVRGFVEYDGEATGTVSTTEETEWSGTLEPSDVSWEDVQVTVVLTEPFASRPVDRVPLEDLRQMAEDHGHMAVLAPVLSESTYECTDDTLTLTSTAQDDNAQEGDKAQDDGARDKAEVTWTFERPAEDE